MDKNEIKPVSYSEQNINIVLGMLNSLMIQGSQAELLANIKSCLQNPIQQDQNEVSNTESKK